MTHTIKSLWKTRAWKQAEVYGILHFGVCHVAVWVYGRGWCAALKERCATEAPFDSRNNSYKSAIIELVL